MSDETPKERFELAAEIFDTFFGSPAPEPVIPVDQLESYAAIAQTLTRRKRLSRSDARKLRRALIVAFGGRCPVCHARHDLIMQIHHIDPVQELGASDQLIPMCPNCHAYVHVLRRVRKDPAKFQALKDELFHVYEGDSDAVDFLAVLASAASTMEKIQMLVKAKTQGDQQ